MIVPSILPYLVALEIKLAITWYTLFLSANTPTIVPLDGFIAPKNQAFGIQAFMGAALTGNVSVDFYWYEK